MSGLTVTAAASGGTVTEIFLRVLVLDNATLPATPNTATASNFVANVTVAQDGSRVYSAVDVLGVSAAPGPAAGNSTIDSVENTALTESHSTFVSTSAQTAGTLFSAGAASGGLGPSPIATAIEVQKFGASITQNASTPAAVFNQSGGTATTAAFNPAPGSKLLLAMVSAGGGTTLGVTDSYGLTWTKAADGNPWIFYAWSPAALAVSTVAVTPAVKSSAYSFTLSALGGYKGYTWAVTAGSLPAGLSLSSAGVVSGTPATPGLSTFTVTVTDQFGNTASAALSLVVNPVIPSGGFIQAGWGAAAGPYSYGTLQIPVSTTDHDWLFVSVSWQNSEDNGIAYCADNVHNKYQPLAFASGTMNTQVFCVPNARAASTVYVATSAFARWLTVTVLDVTGLQPGLTVDASNVYSGGPSTSFIMGLATAQPDFILALGAFAGAPQTITPTGTGATWTTLSSSVNGNASAGITQAASWAATTGAATPGMTYAASSGFYSGVMVAVRKAGGLPANPNPAWPVISCQAAFGYTPQEPTVPPTWTDITSRFLGITGQRGRSFELDELAAGDLTVHLDNFDGALTPGSTGSPYYPNVTLITPVQLLATWQGRTYMIFRGIIHAIPQTFDFQRGMTAVAVSDDYAKLAQTLLNACMIQEMLYDKPLNLWPLNEQQGAAAANNWSGRGVVTLAPVNAKYGGGQVPSSGQYVKFLGLTIGVASLATAQAASTSPPQDTIPGTPTTGFGNANSGTWPAGLAGTADTLWGNTTVQAASGTAVTYQGTALVDSNDSTLPLTSTGATYSAWVQMQFLTVNSVTGAMIMALTDSSGTGGSHNYLSVYYNGSTATVSQTAGSHAFTPSADLFDGKFHLWTVTITTGGAVTLYIDGVSAGSFSGSFPAGTPSWLQFGGDTTATTASAAGLFTGLMSTAGVYDRVVDLERIQSWYQSGATGFLDELGGTRIQRILAWARWSGPQAADPGLSMQQQFNYLTGGYGSNGITGSIGNFSTAGGSAGLANGAQASATISDIANTENGFLVMLADGTLAFRSRTNAPNFPLGLRLGDMDYPLNSWDIFESGLGPWVNTVSCTVAQSAGWSYAGKHSALITVTGTPPQAYAWGDQASVTPGEQMGFSCWVLSPQGCSATVAIDFYNASSGFISTATLPAGVNCPPMTPVFLNLTGVTAPAGAAYAYPHPAITGMGGSLLDEAGAGITDEAAAGITDESTVPGTGLQLYFDRPRLSPAGFLVPYEPDVGISEDIQYLYNDIAITRNVDQATYRARDAASRARYYPRVYPRTIYSSADDATAVTNCANFLLNAFAQPALRVTRVTIDAAANPEAWPFVLSADIGDSVPFTRTPVGGAVITGTFTILSVEPDIGPDKAKFTYVLAPGGVY